MTEPGSNWQEWIGRYEVRHDVVTPGLVTRFGATLDRVVNGDAAPQGIHWCLCLPDAPTAQLGDDGHPRRAGLPAGKAKADPRTDDLDDNFLPPIPLPRRMWASSKVEFAEPIRVGAAIQRTSTIANIADKTGSSGRLVFVTIAHETLSDGVISVREDQTIVYRDASTAAPAFSAPRTGSAQFDKRQWPVSRTLTPGEAMLLRYSALTFNAHRIHYDLPYAREAEGYAGLIVHGPLTATLLLQFANDQFGALRHFAFRGLAPAFCGEAMTLVARRDGASLTLAALGPMGDIIMTAEGLI